MLLARVFGGFLGISRSMHKHCSDNMAVYSGLSTASHDLPTVIVLLPMTTDLGRTRHPCRPFKTLPSVLST